MKRINYLVSLFTVAVILSSCGGIEKMKKEAGNVKYTVTPQVLEEHADKVEITLKGDIPAKYFNKNAIVTATPVLKHAAGEQAFASKTLQGENVEANNDVIRFESGGSFSYTDVIAYSNDMKVSELEVRLTGTIKDNSVEFPPVKVADGVIATPRLVENDPKPILGADQFERIYSESKEADIHFIINKADLRNSELKSEDVKELKAFIKDASADENKELKGVSVSAYASPDGELDLNTKLAEKREKTTEGYVKKELKKSNLEVSDELLRLMSTPEDWDGFKKLMEESEVQDKELILRVLSMYSDPVVREKEIKNISEAYKEIADEILPELRRSKLNVNVDVVGYSDEEITALIDSSSNELNLEEMLYAATLTEDLEQKLTIYTATATKFPESIRAKNNIGVINIQLNKLAEAKTAFGEANDAKADQPIVLNNLGVIALLENDLPKAEEYLLAATDAGKEVNYNLGIIKIKTGEYEAAVNYFENIPSLNAALATLLAGKANAASGLLDQIEEPGAMVYYMKAIIGTRAADERMIMDNLKTAVGKDEALKEAAKTDLEFRNYFENETFKSIVE